MLKIDEYPWNKIQVNRLNCRRLKLVFFCQRIVIRINAYLINLSNFVCIATSSSFLGLQGAVNNTCTKLMIAFRRTTTIVALQVTATIVRNIKVFVAKSSILSTMRMISMNWVIIKKYRKTSTIEVNTLYSSLAMFDDHSIGLHTPPMVYIKKFRENICILVTLPTISLLRCCTKIQRISTCWIYKRND